MSVAVGQASPDPPLRPQLAGETTLSRFCQSFHKSTRLLARPEACPVFCAQILTILFVNLHLAQDYETKVLTGHKALNRYTKPLELWWERDRNERLDTTAADYGCRVRAAMAQLDSIKVRRRGAAGV